MDTSVQVPELTASFVEDAVLLDGSVVIDYTYPSLALSRSCKFAPLSGWIIDGAHLQLPSRAGINFNRASRIPAEDQSGNGLHTDNRVIHGRLARRADLTNGLFAI